MNWLEKSSQGELTKNILTENSVQDKVSYWNNLFNTGSRINELITFISKQVIGRKEIIKQSFFAIMTGEHQIIFSRTGMAKTLLVQQIFSSFADTEIYQKQLTKDTMPDNIFGALDIDQMKSGKMKHNLEGSIVLADFAFLDEIFDANDMLLRSLLSLLNEKKFVNGQQIVDSKLNTLIAASNYVRMSEILEAVVDRFCYKSYIPENKDLYYQMSIDHVYQKNIGQIVEPDRKISLEKLLELKKAIKSSEVIIPRYILFLKNYILRQYIHEIRSSDRGLDNYTISDRTTAKVQNLLRASAILDGRITVNESDLGNLPYLICWLGKEEEVALLKNLINSTIHYFRDDKKALITFFKLFNIFKMIQCPAHRGESVEDLNLICILDEIERSLKGVRFNLLEKLKNFKKLLKNFTNHDNETRQSELFLEITDLLAEMVYRKESLELINGFKADIQSFFKPQKIYLSSELLTENIFEVMNQQNLLSGTGTDASLVLGQF
ncbi:MAG: AAA family ATPase [bacterium]